jgi:Spy/CpxP family protein refolding chaperone
MALTDPERRRLLNEETDMSPQVRAEILASSKESAQKQADKMRHRADDLSYQLLQKEQRIKLLEEELAKLKK